MLNRYLRVLLCKHFLFLSWFIIPVVSLSQTPSFSSQSSKSGFWKNASVGSRFHFGSYLITKTKAEYIKDSYASYGEIYLQFQTKGKSDWEISHRYPQWGISFLYGNTGSRQYIGHMSSVYAWFNLPVIKSHRYTGSILAGTGPGWVSKPFDINTNPKNTLIGTRLNAFIHLALQNEFTLSKRLGLSAGLNFLHLSNGGTTLPNLGINTPAVFAGIRYALGEPIKLERTIKSDFKKTFRYQVFTSMSLKQAPWIGGNYYAINVLQTEATYRFKRNYSLGLGAMFTYNRSLDFFPLENPSYEKRGQKKLQIGTYGSYEHFFGRLSVPLQLGVYVSNRAKSPLLFQQFGLRYGFSKHFSAEFFLKSHMGQADFIHTGIGYIF
jgi:hypothetical protein